MVKTYREKIKNKANQLGCDVSELLAMSKPRDPFFTGSAGDINKAKWFKKIYDAYKQATGEKKVHVRGLHYFAYMDAETEITAPSNLCSWDEYENTKNCSNYMGEAAKVARRLGLVPYNAISDEKNEVTKITHYGTGHQTDISIGPPSIPISVPHKSSYEIKIPMPEDNYESFDKWVERQADFLSRTAKNRISFNRKELAPFHIEVWSEKNIPDRVKKVVKQNADVLVEGEGHLSETVVHQFINRLNSRKKNGVALQLCDFDQAGLKMPVATARKIEKHKRDAKLKHEAYLAPIGITIEQIKEHNLPRKPIDVEKNPTSSGKKAHLTLVNKFEEKMGQGATELQALEAQPELYENIVKTALKKWTVDSSEMREDIRQVKDDTQDSVKETVKDVLRDNQEKIEEFIENRQELAKKLKNVLPSEKELEEINDKFKEARELLENSNSDTPLDSVAEGFETPDVNPPEYDNDTPVRPLLDTNRGYDKQLEVYKEWNDAGKLE